MSTNDLFIGCAVIIVVVSLFVGALVPGVVTAGGVGTELSAPAPWDIFTFAGGGFWALLTFSVVGMPPVINLVFWFILFIELWCLVRLIRGIA